MTSAGTAFRVPGGTDLLDEDLLTLYRYCLETAADLREVGAALDRDPDVIADHLHLPAYRVLEHIFIPPEYREGVGHPPGARAAGVTSLEWAVVQEALAYGDPGAVLAASGPGLSREPVGRLGDQAQRDRFFSRFAERPTWCFFGLTEPNKGSAAMELETRLEPDGDGWLLYGEKRYVGNGARAQLGVVFARRAPGPWGIEAVLIDTSEPGFAGELLPTTGLRGARISGLRFDGVPVSRDQLLGAGRSAGRRGLHGALQALSKFRPGVAALALGQAQAVSDYVLEQRPSLAGDGRHRLDAMLDRTAAIRVLLHVVSADIDRGVVNLPRIGAVKARAARVAEDATRLAADLLGPGSLVEHPWLGKAYRDARGFEFMDGATNLHRLSVFGGLVRSDFFPRSEDVGHAAGH
jgi:alkylation response protein AidB-like acyl-CoA dehydrogenase